MELSSVVVRDPSEYVRQGYAAYLGSDGTEESLSSLASIIREDPSERVSAFALRALLSIEPIIDSPPEDSPHDERATRNVRTQALLSDYETELSERAISSLQSVLANPKRKLPFRMALFEVEELFLRRTRYAYADRTIREERSARWHR